MKPTAPAEPDPPRAREGRGASSGVALFAYGFRPFFLLAGIHATLAIPWWIASLYHAAPSPGTLSNLAWHAHEMLYGFAAAAIAGFLLTAVPSWTGRRGYAGPPLAALVLLWLAGRLAMLLAAGPANAWAAAIDLAFFPALAFMLLPALLRSGARRNLVFILLLALLFAANLQFHLSADNGSPPLLLGLNTILFLLTLIGGRVLPAFTSATLKMRGLDVKIGQHRIIDTVSLFAVGIVLLTDLLTPGSAYAGAAAAAGALLLAMRLARWQGHRCLDEPLLWVLHAAYAWLPLALALKAAALLGLPVPANAWVHALTAGAMATMIIGIMSRAGLGHTGRALVAPPAMSVAYLLLTGAALVRVFGPLFQPAMSPWWHAAAAALWSLAFLLFVVVYAPILCRPRADGRPG